jgi:hypothetical protein
MPDPYTIRIFVPDGDPEGIRIVDLFAWTGKGIVFPRQKWPEVKLRSELAGRRVYILVGAGDDDAGNDVHDDARNIILPIIYVGQSDTVASRIEAHYQNKNFWHWGVVFVSTSAGLGRGHTAWLEHALIRQARQVNQCELDNDQDAKEPALSESEKAGAQGFLKQILQILPLVGLRVFEVGKPVAEPRTPPPESKKPVNEIDTIVVPARRAGFEETFLGKDCWYAVRISGGMLGKDKVYRCVSISPN